MIQQRGMNKGEWLVLLLLSTIWGGSFVFIELALRELRPLAVVWCRVTIAAVVLLVVATSRGIDLRLGWRTWRDFAILALFNITIPFLLIVWGQTGIGAGLAAILNATTPLFTMVIAHLATHDEKMRPNKIAGVLLGIVGVAIVIGPATVANAEGTPWHRLAVLTAACFYGIGGVYGKRFRHLPALAPATGQVVMSSLILLPLVVVFAPPWAAFPLLPATVGALLGLGVLCTALAYSLFFRLLRTAGATNVVLVTLLIPPSAALLAFLLLGERLVATQVAGFLCIAAGLLLVDGRLQALARRAAPAA